MPEKTCDSVYRLTRRKLLLYAALASLGACGGVSGGPEEQLADWIEAGLAGIESKDRRELMKMVSAAYIDGRGNSSDDLENMLRLLFLRVENIGLISHTEHIDIFADSAATVTLTVGMAGTTGGIAGFDADAYRFEFELENDGGNWLLTSARWGELGGALR